MSLLSRRLLGHTFPLTPLKPLWITQAHSAPSTWRHGAFLSVSISGVDVTGKSKFGRLTHAGAERRLVARLIGNGNNWPLGSICLMGGIGKQSDCLCGSLPCSLSLDASLSDAPHPRAWSTAAECLLHSFCKEYRASFKTTVVSAFISARDVQIRDMYVCDSERLCGFSPLVSRARFVCLPVDGYLYPQRGDQQNQHLKLIFHSD